MLTKEQMDELVAEFGENKAQFDKLKKLVESQKTSIKQQLDLMGEEDYSAGGYKVHCTISQRESLDEEKLIQRLKKYAPNTQCIKMKEYIDMEVLENEIYHDKLSDEALSAMAECKDVKEVVTLTVKKDKNDKKKIDYSKELFE